MILTKTQRLNIDALAALTQNPPNESAYSVCTVGDKVQILAYGRLTAQVALELSAAICDAVEEVGKGTP